MRGLLAKAAGIAMAQQPLLFAGRSSVQDCKQQSKEKIMKRHNDGAAGCQCCAGEAPRCCLPVRPTIDSQSGVAAGRGCVHVHWRRTVRLLDFARCPRVASAARACCMRLRLAACSPDVSDITLDENINAMLARSCYADMYMLICTP